MGDEPKKRSWAWIGWSSLTGLPFLWVIVLFFVFGVCVIEAVVETLWPQCDNVIWIRLAGGIAALFALAFGLKRSRHFRKVVGSGLALYGSGLALFVVGIVLRIARLAAGVGTAPSDERPDPNFDWLTFLGPLVVFAAGVWMVAFIWRRIRPN